VWLPGGRLDINTSDVSLGLSFLSELSYQKMAINHFSLPVFDVSAERVHVN
jgi:hypothetical protein